jgi:uncharacterized protein
VVATAAHAERLHRDRRLIRLDWAAIWRDTAIGLLIAGALAAWVPHGFWQGLFLANHPTFAKIWGPLIAPAVAIISFVCSVGNVPLAAVLWNGGISFGGVLAFIFADLLILPILHIYKKYYGWRMASFLLVTFYATMVAAGLIVEFVFQGIGIERTARNANVMEASVAWNYTTVLNIIFLSLAAVLVWGYFRYGGGWKMLKMMEAPMDAHEDHGQTAARPKRSAGLSKRCASERSPAEIAYRFSGSRYSWREDCPPVPVLR